MVDVSFVMPAFNERRFLPGTLESVRRYADRSYTYEIIVVDHGSTDDTVELARAAGAKVFEYPGASTISVLRNLGVHQATGRFLVFLDADTTLTSDWQAAFPRAVKALEQRPLTISGATRGIPDTAAWVSRMWFSGLSENPRPTHLGGGHIVTTRALFDAVGGFPPELETGEDYEFCLRARGLGAEIVVIPELRALHHGVPDSVGKFFRRELWHGRGEWQATSSLLKSKVAAGTIMFLALHVACLVGLSSATATGLSVSLATAAGVCALCLASALAKYAGQPVRVVASNSLLFFLFYAARVLSLASVLVHRATRKHIRAA